MQVEYLATMSLPDDGWDVNMLEGSQKCCQGAFPPGIEARGKEGVSQSRRGKER